MAHTIALTLDDRTYAELEVMARNRGETPESIAASAVHTLCEDPLLSLAGCLDTGTPDLALRHDCYLAEASDPALMAGRDNAE
jgi:hypothetical protein